MMITSAAACPSCGTLVLHDVTTLDQVQRSYICENGHFFREVEFREGPFYWPKRAVLVWTARPGRDLEVRQVMVYCGPEASLPAVPTPDELLKAAGGWAWWAE